MRSLCRTEIYQNWILILSLFLIQNILLVRERSPMRWKTASLSYNIYIYINNFPFVHTLVQQTSIFRTSTTRKRLLGVLFNFSLYNVPHEGYNAIKISFRLCSSWVVITFFSLFVCLSLCVLRNGPLFRCAIKNRRWLEVRVYKYQNSNIVKKIIF